MRSSSLTRKLRPVLALGLVFAAAGMCAQQHRGGGGGGGLHQVRMPAQPHAQQAPAPVERRPPGGTGPGGAPQQSQLAPIVRRNPQAQGTKGEHLAEWMSQHSNLTVDQQQQALDREPGFRDLPAQTQERMHERLSQLNAMTPEQRQRLLAHNEIMERLNPDQRAQVRGAMQELGALPEDQRRAVARSFRELRELPPDQRAAAMNSDRYTWMNPAQRATMNNLLRVEPMLPPPER
jgi:hypothetical protein